MGRIAPQGAYPAQWNHKGPYRKTAGGPGREGCVMAEAGVAGRGIWRCCAAGFEVEEGTSS